MVFVSVAESIEKPGNLGALLRTADSAGCTALICCGDAGTDIYNPNAIRASQGTLFSVPLAVASNEAAFAWLKAQGVTVFATSPAAKKVYWDCDFRVPAAILMGTEATGLTDFWYRKWKQYRPRNQSVSHIGEPKRQILRQGKDGSRSLHLFDRASQRFPILPSP